MIDNCLRCVPVFIAVYSRTISDIRIFQIGKMFFIKITDPFKDLPSIDCRSSTGRKYLFFLLVGMNVLYLASGKGPAQCIVKVSRIIQTIPVMILNHPGRTGKSFLVSPDRSSHLFQKIFLHFCIIIEQQYIGCSGCLDSLIDRTAEPIVFRQFDDVHPRVIPRYKRAASI